MDKPFGGRWIRQGPVGGTPTGATGTVALPVFNCMVPVKLSLLELPFRGRELNVAG